MNIELLNKINEEVQAGKFGVLCTVTSESGSTPRSRGATATFPSGSPSSARCTVTSNRASFRD